MISPDSTENILMITDSITAEDSLFIHEWVEKKVYSLGVHKSIISMMNVRGGKVCLSLLEMLMEPTSNIDTWGIGYLYSAATDILIAGRHRFVHPDAELMFHFPSGRASVKSEFMNTHVRMLAGLTGLEESEVIRDIYADFRYDRYMGPEEALNLGLVDSIISDVPDAKEYTNNVDM